MSRRRYAVWNAATAALTAAPTAVTTGTAIKTMLQVKPTTPIVIVEWGYSFDVVPTALVRVELITTGTVNATVTQFAAGDVVKYDDPSMGASAISLGTAASGFTSSAEGTVTASRLMDYQLSWAQQFSKQFPLDREPGVVANDILRIRMTTATAINATAYIVFEE
jgi:hypothetical protein